MNSINYESILEHIENIEGEIFGKSYSAMKKDCIEDIANMISYILMVYYADNKGDTSKWYRSIMEHKGRFCEYVKWGTENPVDILIKYVSEHIDDCYDYAVVLCLRESRELPDLKLELSEIPDECPWSLDELIDESIYYLLNEIDDQEIDDQIEQKFEVGDRVKIVEKGRAKGLVGTVKEVCDEACIVEICRVDLNTRESMKGTIYVYTRSLELAKPED